MSVIRPGLKVRTMKKTLMACAGIAWIGAIGFEASKVVQASAPPRATIQAPAASGAAAATPARELVTKYCITCHNERVKTANLLLDKVDAGEVFNSAETWEKVIVKLRARAMPPPGRAQPDNAT